MGHDYSEQTSHKHVDLVYQLFSFLQQLSHPNIVKLHGVTAGSVETNVASGRECGFFIVVDRLYETLEERIDKWRLENEASGNRNIITRLSKEHREKKKQELKERIRIAASIANAMEYLHSKNIVFRDLVGVCAADDLVKQHLVLTMSVVD